MSFEREFLDCMTEAIEYQAPDGSFTARGQPGLGAAVSIQARIVEENTIIFDDEGLQRVAAVTIWLATTSVLDPEGKLTLPANFTPRCPPILEVARFPDEDGAHHTRIRVTARRT